MLRTKKNKLFDLIKDSEIDISLFEGTDLENTESSDFLISLIDSSLSFKVITSDKSFDYHATIFSKFRAGYPSFRFPGKEGMYSGKWSDVIGKLDAWLKLDVKRYLDEKNALDLWDTLTGRSPAIVDPLATIDVEYFTASEKEEVTLRLELFRSELHEKFADNETLTQDVNRKFDYLISKLDGLNRTDWKSLALGALISLAISLNIDTDTGDDLKQWLSETSKPVILFLSDED